MTLKRRSMFAPSCLVWGFLACGGGNASTGLDDDAVEDDGSDEPGDEDEPGSDDGGSGGEGDRGGESGNGGSGGAGGTPPIPADPKVVAPLRRLTRIQYNNAVHDLLGIFGDYAESFAIDEEEAGFKSNARAPVKELQLEAYQQAAEDVAAAAVSNLSRIVPCAPPAGQEAACVDEFVRGFGKRALRRPLTDAEVDRYKMLFTEGKTTGGSFGSGIGLVVSAILQSPSFLYRVELGEPGDSGNVRLTPYETAARLSFFLWNSIPDDELLAAADANKLRTPDELAAQARRMLAVNKSTSTIVSFARQWLEIEELASISKDMTAFPTFTSELATAMDEEAALVADDVMRRGDGRFEALLTGTISFVKGPLYALYGIPAPTQQLALAAMRRIDLPAAQRAGIFTLSGVLAQHAHVDQTAPVKRGVLISEKLLCVVPPPPPPGVDANPPTVDPNVSTRKRFEQHRADPACAECHALIDPYGMAFETYDAIGRWRTMDGTQPVDASVDITGTQMSNGRVKNGIELVKKLAAAPEARDCMTRQWFRYLYGREEHEHDDPTLNEARGAFERSGNRIPDLLVGLVTTKAFTHLRTE